MPEAQDQVGLPAWLESLRAGERSAAPVNNASPFSAPNFAEEGSLPSWMRPEREEGTGNTGVNPVIATGGGQGMTAQPSQGITAGSLVDENALPPWLRDGKIAPEQATPSTPAQPATGQPIQASSLVEQDDVPEWMKSLQPQEPTVMRNERRQESAPVAAAQPVVPPSGVSAHDLIDPQALPDWMKTQGNRGSQGVQSNMPVARGVRQQESDQKTARPPVPEQGGFSASSLLDENSLPQWLRESGANAGRSAASGSGSGWGNNGSSPVYPPAGNTNGRASTQGNDWPAQVPPQTPMSAPTAQAGQGMAASSFIDEDALPPWLRSADQQRGSGSGVYGSQANPAMGSQARQNAPAPIAPRQVDNIRVPNRPRNESSINDTSENAASVFASMLGVASAAPNYLGQQPSTPQPGQPAMPPSAPTAQGPAGYGQDYRVAQGNASFSGSQQGNQSPIGSNAGAAGAMGYSGAPNMPASTMPQGQGYNPAMANATSMGGGYGSGQPAWGTNGPAQGVGSQGSAMGGGASPQMIGVANANNANIPSAMNNYGSPASPAQIADQSGDQKGKKRGLFGAFLDWLSR
jgi:hypothetical protein